MTQDTTRKALMKSGTMPPNLEEQIRQRAFELYEARDREDGHALDDWLSAEQEMQRRTRTTAA